MADPAIDLEANTKIADIAEMSAAPPLEIEEKGKKKLWPPRCRVNLDFHNINYTARVQKQGSNWMPAFLRTLATEDKPVLHEVSGSVSAGQILTIMGPSGSGKTSLLNILTGRVPATSGTVSLNGKPNCLSQHKDLIAYVTQDDLLMSGITVYENLRFKAKMSLPDDKQYRLNEVVDSLGLRPIEHSIVGSGAQTLMGGFVPGISGGERKRVAIAEAMLSDPSIIILDEPLSGLDSANAAIVLQMLSDMAESGRTVIMTIHQPSSSMFEGFDRLLLLSGGKLMYYGKASDSVAYFAERGYPCPRLYNPADYFIGLFAEKKELPIFAIPGSFASAEAEGADDLPEFRHFSRNWFEQVGILYRRHIRYAVSSIAIFPYIQVIIVGIIMGVLFWRLALTDGNVMEKNAVLLFTMIFAVGFSVAIVTMIAFASEKGILIKERNSKIYYLSAWYVAKRLAEMPIEMIFPTIWIFITYWMAAFRANAYFLAQWYLMMITTYISAAFGLCIVAAISNFQIAMNVIPIFILTMVLTVGFYRPVSELPKWIRWTSWLSYFRYSYEGAIYVEYVGRSIELDGASHFFSAARVAELGNATHASAEMVFGQLGIVTNLWIDTVVLLGWWAFYGTLAYVLIRVRVK